MKIFTGSYSNCNGDITVSISRDKGKDAGYTGKYYTKLGPSKSFWKEWHDNIGVISEEENNRFYMEKYYDICLSNLDAREVYEDLNTYGDTVVMLCYENPNEFCHRFLVAAWLELKLDILVDEVRVLEDGSLQILDNRDDLKNTFKSIIKEKESVKKLVK